MREIKLLQELEHVFEELTPADFLSLKKKNRIGEATKDESARYRGIAGKIDTLRMIIMLDSMSCETFAG